MKTTFVVLLILFSAVPADDYIDIAGTDSTLYVALGNELRIWDTSTSRVFPGPALVTVGLARLNDQDVVLLSRSFWSETDSLYVLDPMTLETVCAREILPGDLAWSQEPAFADCNIRLARHQPGEGSFHLSSAPIDPVSGAMYSNAVSARLVIQAGDDADTGPEIVIADTLGTGAMTYYGAYREPTPPVFCGTAELPMMFWSEYGSYVSACFGMYAALHQIDGDPVQGNYEPILPDCFYFASGCFSEGYVKCAGASQDEVVLMWSTEDESQLMYSVYDCTGVVEICELPMEAPPEPEVYMALSRNPDDPGMLLAWADGVTVRCRHRENGLWSPWVYDIDAQGGTLLPDGIRVAGVTDGYWVAWRLSGSSEPEVRFVPRDTVTGIDAAHAGVQRLSLIVAPNPCGSSAIVRTTGAFQGELHVHDLEGRVVETLCIPAEGQVRWNTEGLPAGTYLIRAAEGSGEPSARVVVLR